VKKNEKKKKEEFTEKKKVGCQHAKDVLPAGQAAAAI
jgi:hypothetical protein